MKIAILVLLSITAVLAEDGQNRHNYPQEANRRISYSTSVVHTGPKDGSGNAKSSINVNFNNSGGKKVQYQTSPKQHYPQYVYTQQAPQTSHRHNQGVPQSQGYKNTKNVVQYHQQVQPSNHATYSQYQGHQQIPTQRQVLQYHQEVAQPSSKHVYYQQLPPQGRHLQYQESNKNIVMLKPSGQNAFPGLDLTNFLEQAKMLQAQPAHSKAISVPKSPIHLQAPQAYNVGYSINIENNNPPKLMYREPNPPSVRQQKYLNADVIRGSHKAHVEKPSEYGYLDYKASESQTEGNSIHPNYLSEGQTHQIQSYVPEPTMTQVYSDVKNTHGYTWKTLSPGVEISGYHNLNDLSKQQQSQAQTFDHAAALGRSQGFDISNVIDKGEKRKHSSVVLGKAQGFDIPKSVETPTIQYQQSSSDSSDISKFVEDAKAQYQQPISLGHNQGIDYSNLVDASGQQPIASALHSPQFLHPQPNPHSTFDFSHLQHSGLDLNLQSTNQHNFFSAGNLEFDKTLLNDFYKNFKPASYSPEVTLPAPNLPEAINGDFKDLGQNHELSSHSQNIESLLQQTVQSQPAAPELMANQHYAFVQAEQMNQPQALALVQAQPAFTQDVKPVQEAQEEDYHQAQQSETYETIVKPEEPKETRTFEKNSLSDSNKERRSPKYMVPSSSSYAPRAVMFVGDKDYKLRTSLRPPPMIFIQRDY